MGTVHSFKSYSPITENAVRFVQSHVRRISRDLGCDVASVDLACKHAENTLRRTGSDSEAIVDGVRFAAQAEHAARHHRVPDPWPAQRRPFRVSLVRVALVIAALVVLHAIYVDFRL